MRPFPLRLALCLALCWGASAAFAGPTEATIRQTATRDIVEFGEFFDVLRAKAKSDPILVRVGFNPETDVALSGGICREIAWKLTFQPGTNVKQLAEVHAPDRDLDLIYLGGADGKDEDYVLGVLRDTMQESLSKHGANVMRLDVHAIREKEEEDRLPKQGYDTVSQALITPSAVFDIAVLLKYQEKDESTAALLKPTIVYHLPHGPLTADGDFLHQLVQVIRVFKIAAEFPGAVVDAETETSLRTVLTAFKAREKALEAFLKAASDRGENYFRNRLDDVFTALLRLHGGGELYKKFEEEFGLSKFAPLRALVTNAAVVRRNVPVLASGEPKAADLARILAPGERYPMGDGMFFDPRVRQIIHVGGKAETTIPLALIASGAGFEGLAYSGQRGPAEPELLPVDKWEVLRVRKYAGTQWAAVLRNRRTNYHVVGIVDTKRGKSAQILFLNGRSFSRESSNGRYVGQKGPMIGMNDVAIGADGSLIGYGANGVFSQMTLEGSSFKFSTFMARGPVRARPTAIEVIGGVVYMLAVDGQLYVLSNNGPASLILDNVLGIARGPQGLLAYVEEQPSKTPALYLFDRTAEGYRRLPFPKPEADALPLAIAGDDGAVALRRRYGDRPTLGTESPALAYLRRPESELLASLRTLEASLPPGLELRVKFGQIAAPELKPELLTDDTRTLPHRIGILTTFRGEVLASKDNAQVRATLGEIFLLRLVLELRRGRTSVFPFGPNTFVLNRLFELCAEFASPNTIPMLAELASADTIDELIFREPVPAGVKNGALDPKFVFFIKQKAATEFADSCAATVSVEGT